MLTLFQVATLAGWTDIYRINYFGCDRHTAGIYMTLSHRQELAKLAAYAGESAPNVTAFSDEIVSTMMGTFYRPHSATQARRRSARRCSSSPSPS